MATFEASIAGLPILIDDQGMADSLSKALVKHEFPDRDGAFVEDLGQKGRVVKFRAICMGEDYERHEDILSLLEVADTYELVHPVYGVMVGAIETLDVRHNDRIRYAELDITFAEDLIGSTEESLVDIFDEDKAKVSFLAGLAAQASSLSKAVADDMRTLGNAIALTAYTSQVEACISSLEGALVAVELPANALISTITWATDLPGRLLGAIANTVERYCALYETVKDAPERFVRSFRNGMTGLKDSLQADYSPSSTTKSAKEIAVSTVQKHITITAAFRLGLEVAALYAADEDARTSHKKAETTPAFDAAGNYLDPELPDPIMIITDIEQSLADTRTELQAALDIAPELQSLNDMAADLLAHVDKIKIEREKIVFVTIENTMPLHLVCLKHGLPSNTAERILAINPQITHPSFVSGDIKIYAK